MSPTIADNIKKYAGAFISLVAAFGIVMAPITVWAVGEIEDIANKVVQEKAPQIVTILTNKKFDEVYMAGFSELDQRNRRIEDKQLLFQYKIEQVERDAHSRGELQQEKLKGINDKLDMLIRQMRSQQSDR